MAVDKIEKKVSPYTLLDRWLRDGSKDTKLPADVESDKSISQIYVLYYFRGSPYGLVMSKLMNNWGITSLDRNELLYFLKECVSLTGFKPPFIQKMPAQKNKLTDCFKEKYPFLKKEEISMLIELVDQSEEKDLYYESFGIYSPKVKKITKAQQKQMAKEKDKVEPPKEAVDLDKLMESFT